MLVLIGLPFGGKWAEGEGVGSGCGPSLPASWGLGEVLRGC